MTLSDAIAWARVELDSRKPNLEAIKQVLDTAHVEAARITIKHHVGQNNFIRLAQACGDTPGTVRSWL